MCKSLLCQWEHCSLSFSFFLSGSLKARSSRSGCLQLYQVHFCDVRSCDHGELFVPSFYRPLYSRGFILSKYAQFHFYSLPPFTSVGIICAAFWVNNAVKRPSVSSEMAGPVLSQTFWEGHPSEMPLLRVSLFAVVPNVFSHPPVGLVGFSLVRLLTSFHIHLPHHTSWLLIY